MATDLVNEQLRKAFITINAKADKDAQSKKKKRRKLSSKDRAKAAERAAQSAAEWEQAQRTRPCRECGKPAKADPVFFLNPVISLVYFSTCQSACRAAECRAAQHADCVPTKIRG